MPALIGPIRIASAVMVLSIGSAAAQPTSALEAIYDSPCSEMIEPTGSDLAPLINSHVAAIFVGFAVGRLPESEARQALGDVHGLGLSLGALCESEDVTLVEAMSTILQRID